MASLLSMHTLILDDQSAPLSLELMPGMQALCRTSDDQQTLRLLQLFTGLLIPDQGQVLLDGIATSSLSRQQLLKLRCQFGIITPSGGLIANLKLWENIMLPLSYCRGGVTEAAEQQAEELLRSFGYNGNLLALPGHLSVFERRIAAFVRAAITRPRMMLYAGCFETLTPGQRQLLLNQAQLLHQTIPGLVSLYLTSSSSALKELQPDITCNLKLNATGQ